MSFMMWLDVLCMIISHELDADFTKYEVDTVLRHLPSGKSHGWDGLTNEVFKRYSNILKGPLTLMFQHSWGSWLYTSRLEGWSN